MRERQLAIEEICLRALEMGPEERGGYLRQACADDAMRKEVDSLLAVAGDADSLFRAPAGWFPAKEGDPVQSSIGEQIGPYRLLDRLGEGGMGIVFRAAQSEPVRREVAVKIIRPGLDSALVVSRFNTERQALALMDHPNIARVVDAGTTAADRPYFVMELVRGEAITTHCDKHSLSVRERVQLLIPVCLAIQHAHRNGVIHRDIKPSNILVATGENGAVPKVIDFGIAKATSLDNPGEAGAFTRAFDIIGTLEYMSPEQAEPSGKGVDVRADVYALGAVFYELMTGAPPLSGLSLREAGLGTLLKRIQEEAPRPPRQRVRAGSPALAPECDWIALKALEKDRERRYESAGALARDLQSFLDGRPVEAGPPSTLYRLRKLARRHRAWVATAAMFVLVLLAATAVSSWQAYRANRAEGLAIQERDRARMAEQTARAERDHALTAEADMRRAQALTLAEKARADQEMATAQAVASFLQDDLLAQASPNAQATTTGSPNADLTVRTLLERSSNRLATKFADQPAVRASLEHTIAVAYLDLGLYAQSREHAQRAAEIRKKLLGARHRLTHASLDRLAMAYRGEGKLADAERIWTDLLDYQRSALGQPHPDTLQSMHSLAALYRSQGKSKEAIPLYETALQLRRRVLGADHPETLRTSSNLAYAYLFVGKAKEGLALQEDTLERRRRTLGPEHPDTMVSMSNLGLAYEHTRRLAEARRILEDTYQMQRRILGEAHTSVLSTALNLGRVLWAQSGPAEAAVLIQQAVEIAKAHGQEKDPLTLTMMNNLGLYHIEAQRLEPAVEVLDRALPLAREVLGADHPDSLRLELNLANALRKQKKFAQAEPLMLRVIEVRTRSSGAEHTVTLHTQTRLVDLYLDTGRFAEAAGLAGRVWEIRRRRSGEADSLTADSLVQRVRAAIGLGQYAAARDLGLQALELRRKGHGKESAQALEVVELLAENARQSGQWQERR